MLSVYGWYATAAYSGERKHMRTAAYANSDERLNAQVVQYKPVINADESAQAVSGFDRGGSN